MTVSDLIADLTRYPPNLPVYVEVCAEQVAEMHADVSLASVVIPIVNLEHSQTPLGFGVTIVTG